MGILKILNDITGEWENIPAIEGKEGKSAYQYAVDGGYTGTETEFAAKLAQEIPKIDPTLTQSGQASDSKATGDAIRALSEKISGIPQADWNQNDDTQPDYIKNKPLIATNDYTMDFLADMGMITPVTNSSGEILISPSNEIYSL